MSKEVADHDKLMISLHQGLMRGRGFYPTMRFRVNIDHNYIAQNLIDPIDKYVYSNVPIKNTNLLRIGPQINFTIPNK